MIDNSYLKENHLSTSRHGRFSFLAVTVLILVLSLTLASCGSITSSPNSYSVTYDGNGNTGGSVPIDPNKYVNEQTVTVLGNTGILVKTGYAFVGWNTLADGSGATYTQAQTFTMGAANVTLYAIWTTNPTYTVTYDGNGNTSGSVPVDTTNYVLGQTVTVLGNTGNLVKTGYSFVGWSTQADGSGATYSQAQTFTMGTVNVTLYAKWTTNPVYTVTYNGNGNTSGSVPVDSTNYEQGQTVTVLGNIGNLVNTGYSFADWNTQANGSGATYPPAQTFIMGAANVTLYAKWSVLPNHTVTFNSNGGTGSMSNQIANVPTVLTANAFTRTGFTFSGWNTAANGSGTSYANVATYPFAADVTLYAQWSALPNHTVTFNGNGGAGSMSNQIANVPTALTANAFTRTGYTFSGWNTQAAGGGTSYADGAIYPFAADITLYAQWSALPNHTVTFNSNGGSGSMSNQIANVPTALTANAFTRLGYTFSGWNTAAAGGGTSYADGAIYSFAADITLYAQWSALPNHTVTFNSNGGTGSMSNQIANVPTALTANAFTRTGYTFSGWNTAAMAAARATPMEQSTPSQLTSRCTPNGARCPTTP